MLGTEAEWDRLVGRLTDDAEAAIFDQMVPGSYSHESVVFRPRYCSESCVCDPCLATDKVYVGYGSYGFYAGVVVPVFRKVST